MKCLMCESKNYSASRNLAVEEYLFGVAARKGCAILYLWQNENAVVLGRNQNAYDEVDMDAAGKYGICVVRRMTGGGAVFHDLGNLNYTLILPIAYEKKDIMYQMLLNAFGELGITVLVSGRNDIYVDGYKFSGNAFYTNGESYLHHGTILVDSDIAMMNALLCVPSGKMAKRAVKSVQAKVKNIKDLLPDITINDIKQALVKEYGAWAGSTFGLCLEQIQVEEPDIENLIQKYNDPLWNIGDGKRYRCERKAVYEWGNAQIVYNQEDGIVTDAKIYTDSLQVDEVENAKRNFIGKNVSS